MTPERQPEPTAEIDANSESNHLHVSPHVIVSRTSFVPLLVAHGPTVDHTPTVEIDEFITNRPSSPTTSTTMTSIYRQQEDSISEAIASLNGQPCTNIASLAREFGAPERRLRNRYMGAPSKLENNNAVERLSDSQDLAVMKTLDRLEDCGLHARPAMLTSIANAVLRASEGIQFNHSCVSKMWASRWLKRFPQYKIIIAAPLAIERKNAHDPNILQKWFDGFHKIITEKGILPSDISNVDETGFRVGVGRRHKVISRDPSKKVYMADADNRSHVTVVECVQADGTQIPPMVILPGKRHLERNFPPGLPNDVLMAVSDTGYNNDELSMDWLRHYDKHTKQRQQGVYRLLLFDGFGSHLLIDFIQYCWDNSIIPMVFPPHATHLMQPLDVVIFQPYKHYHSEALDKAVRLGFDEFTVQDFLQELDTIRRQTFKRSTILSSFRETGLVPFNPNVVLDKLAGPPADESDPFIFDDNDRLDLDISLDDESWLADQVTPTNVRQFEVAKLDIQRCLTNLTDEFEDLRWALERFMKGSLATAQIGQLALEELAAVRRAMQSRQERTSRTGRVVQKGGVVTCEQARRKIAKRIETDDEKLDRLLKARNAREAKAETKAIERAATDERIRIRAVKAAATKLAVAQRKADREAKKAEKAADKLARELLDPRLS
jgi:hypothetical protein